MTTDERVAEYILFCRKYAPTCSDDRIVEWLLRNNYFDAPASTKYHGVYPGGLFDHSLAVARRLVWLTESLDLKWQDDHSPAKVGLYHDLCKCDQYTQVGDDGETGIKYEYNTGLALKGHGAKSIILLSQLMTLTEEEALCIRYHMGPYEKEEWSEFDLAIHKYPNVLYTHTADMLASKVDET